MELTPKQKLINSAEVCVDEALCGLVRAKRGPLSDGGGPQGAAALRPEPPEGESGSAVGRGVRTRACTRGFYWCRHALSSCSRGVFASPPPASILAAILCLHNAGAQGVLLIVKNYTATASTSDWLLSRPLAGALEKEGCSLSQIVSKVTELLKGIGTLGVSLSPCSVPGSLPSFDLPPGDMEIGLGIHGEPGIKRSKIASADEVSRGVVVARVMSGSFMTSLEMVGVSLTVMTVDQETLRLFDAKTSAPAWPNLSSVCVSGRSFITEAPEMSPHPQDHTHKEGPLSPVMRKALVKVCTTLLEKQEELNALDRASGDGDCGNTHAQAAKAIQEWLQNHVVPGCPGRLLSVLAGLVQERMGGYGGADVGDRTMLDALCPAVDELMKLKTAPPGGQLAVLQNAVKKASLGAESTLDLTAMAGRASYIAAERVSLPDPGAVAVATIMRTVMETLEEK
ncbi:hypothetical protein KUCAC02_034711 [Chaenocephalus aceratus]|nr:hypothetical protein KUCAC02_034711 [Chaenocephalus aceratus]